MDVTLWQAEPDDAEIIARVIRETSAGVVDYLLGGLSRVLSPQRLLTPVIMETGHPLSHENVLLLRQGQTLAGLLLAYPATAHGIPDILRKVVAAQKLDLLDGLLRVVEPESLYINTLWVNEAYRGSGVADDLIECALVAAADRGLGALCLHVWVENARAVRFYQRHGFVTTRHFEVPAKPRLPYTGGYDLMKRDLAPARRLA